MPTYSYQARTKDGEMRSGVIQSSSQEAALDTLQQNGLVVTTLLEEKKRSSFKFKLPLIGGVKQKDIVVFSRQLATLFEARVPVIQALKTMIGETESEGLKEAVAQILDDVSGGLSLSQSMGKYPDIFTPFYLNLIRSGEESGKLQEVFSYLADYIERSYYLTSKARNAMIYPAFIMIAIVGVLIVMLAVVVPKLTDIFKQVGQEVPLYTQIIITMSDFLVDYGLFLLLAFIIGAVIIWRWSLTIGGKWFFHSMQIKLPIIGTLFKKLFMARFTDNLRTMIISGIPILRALEISGDVVGNVVYQKAIADSIESVKGGSTISAALERTPEVPVLVTQMIRIGEASGRLDFILESVSKFYQRDVDSALESLVSLIEPLLIIILGLGVGVIVAAVLVPLYNLVGAF